MKIECEICGKKIIINKNKIPSGWKEAKFFDFSIYSCPKCKKEFWSNVRKARLHLANMEGEFDEINDYIERLEKDQY